MITLFGLKKIFLVSVPSFCYYEFTFDIFALSINIFYLDSYHLRCIGLTAKDSGIENYKCSYCEILKGESHYPSGGGLLVGYYVIAAIVN